jgi:hypothetical protein
MKTAVFDCDDVLANIRELTAEVLSGLCGRSIHWNDWDTYDLSVTYGVETDRCLAAFVEHRVLERATPEPHAKETLLAASEAGLRTMVLTARDWHPDGESLTQKWLAAHDLVVDELRLVSVQASKVAALEDTDAVFFVDDNPRHVIEAEGSTHVRTPILMSRPWNRGVTVRHRIGHLGELAPFLNSWRDPSAGGRQPAIDLTR